jgi:putative tricarboxylic transport membrane protein
VWHARVFGAVAVLALGVAVIAVARELPYHSDYGPGPGFLPTWIGGVLAACGAVLAAQELRAARRGEPLLGPQTRTAAKLLAAIVVTFLLVPLLGLSVALALFIGATMRMIGRHRWSACAGAAIVTALGIHQLFGGWLDIPLPAGRLGW